MSITRIILASSSPYRCALLERLRVPFIAISPDIDESPLLNETATELVRRLALHKAKAVLSREHDSVIVIGSDQVAVLDGAVLTKPGSHAPAVEQLLRCSGREVVFYTSLAVFTSESLDPRHIDVVETVIKFRELSSEQIESYLRIEQPYDCAGSFKVEGLGICLFESVSSQDPTALVGLPLVSLSGALDLLGVNLLNA